MQITLQITYRIFSNLDLAMGEQLLTASTHYIALVTKDANECVLTSFSWERRLLY